MPRFPLTSTDVIKTDTGHQSRSRSCARIKRLGYVAGKRMKLYGEHFEIVSDPFVENECVAIRATSGSDPTIRTIQLPVSILAGMTDLFPEHAS
jgi:hypothetical protein